MKRKHVVFKSLSSGVSEKPLRINSVTMVSFVIAFSSHGKRESKNSQDSCGLSNMAKHTITKWSVEVVKINLVLTMVHESHILFFLSCCFSILSEK